MKNKSASTLPIGFWENIPINIAFHDLDCNIQWVNRAYRKTIGLQLEEIIGRKCFSIWGQAHPCHPCPVKAAFETDESELVNVCAEPGHQTQCASLAKAVAIKDDKRKHEIRSVSMYDGVSWQFQEGCFEQEFYKKMKACDLFYIDPDSFVKKRNTRSGWKTTGSSFKQLSSFDDL